MVVAGCLARFPWHHCMKEGRLFHDKSSANRLSFLAMYSICKARKIEMSSKKKSMRRRWIRLGSLQDLLRRAKKIA